MKTLDPLVRIVASAMLQLGYYRSERIDEASQIAIPRVPIGLQRLAASVQALAIRCGATREPIEWARGIGFAETSPLREDADLERDLGRPDSRRNY